MNILEVKDLSKSFGKLNVLREINLSIPQGSIFGLLGPNGAGKTTFIRIVNQIIGPDNGRIYFSGVPLKRKDISRIGYLPEERGLYNKMKIGEHLIYLAQLKGIYGNRAKSIIKNLLEEFEITDWWNMRVEQLSKGMQQKLQFIIAIMHSPTLIILDEPFTGFDPINIEVIKQKVIKLRNEGISFILSTHRMDSVEELCNHIALINKAELILEGNVANIKEKFKNNIFEIKGMGQVEETLFEMTGSTILSLVNEDNVFKLRIKLPENGDINELLVKILHKAKVLSLNEIVPTINEIFISMVNQKSHG